ncbi:hypothetical protein DFH08DRAFT_1075669 [Mycena albidolilacea]|uniref:Uncharacterized protein n=1 Tax=Mycena albidolilacea TaxID=1033008 RepID=A0AAD7EYN2_9AGAR|nr:hypothetical protein DFH08DRAFT_1075669 [Mycena albidolilacea]
MHSAVPDEIISEILSPSAIKISDDDFSNTEAESPFASISESTSAYLLAQALEAAFKSNKDLGAFIKKLRVEGGYGPPMKAILEASPNITDLALCLAIWGTDKVSGLCQGLDSINPIRLFIRDMNNPGNNKQNLQLADKLVERIPLWQRLKTIDVPYTYVWPVRRCGKICDALMTSPSLEEVVIPFMFELPEFLFDLQHKPSLKTIKIKYPLTYPDSVELEESLDDDPDLKRLLRFTIFGDPGIAPPSNPSFVPMESAPQEVQDKIWERVLYFALRMEELDVYASSDVHVAVPNDSDHYDYSDDLEPLLMSDSMLVSKRFNRLSAPFLHRHADLVNPGDLSRFAAVLNGDRTIAKHVRSLAFTYEAMLPSMPDDDLLDFSQEMKEGCHHKLRSDAEDLLLSILPFLDGLVSFTDGSTTNTSYPPHLQSNEGLVLPWTALRTLATAAGTNLLRLCVGVIPPSEIQSPLVLAPFLALRSLEWQCSVEFGHDPAEPTLAPEALANLECLSLVEYHPSFMGALAAAELPALRRVYFHASIAPTAKRFFERHGGKLTEVRLGAHDPGEVNVLDACPILPQLICGSHGNFRKPSEAKSLPSVELLTPSKPHLYLTKLILDAYFADHRKEKTMGPFLDSLDTALLPALREIQVPILRWPTTEREISKSPWIQCAEKLLSRGIALQDGNGKHWTPRLKRGRR